MPLTPMFNYSVPDDSVSLELDTIIADSVQSIEDNSPIQYVATFAALNAMTGTLHPNGQTAVLTADDTGLRAGSTFVRSGGKWLFNTGATTDLPTFYAALTANVGTMPGASFYDVAGGASRIFTNTTGNSEILVGGNSWVNVPYASGYQKTTYGDPLSYRFVPGGFRVRGHIQRTNGKAIPASAVIGNLPSPARPSNGQYFVASGGSSALGNMLIQADGDIILGAPIGRTSSWYSLDNVFLAIN